VTIGVDDKSVKRLLEALPDMADMLNQCLDINSNFYKFVDNKPQHTEFLTTFTNQLQPALGYQFDNRAEKKCYTGTIKDNKGVLTYHLFGTYIEAIGDLLEKDKSKLTFLLNQRGANQIVRVFDRYLNKLQQVNHSFSLFQIDLKEHESISKPAFSAKTLG